MEIIDFNKPISDRMSIALGHFDAIHNGHFSLIKQCKNSGEKCGVFLFDKNPLITLGREAKVLHTLKERLFRLESLGVDYAIIAKADEKFLSLKCNEFADKLCRFNLGMVVVGDDYRCGKGGCADAEYLSEILKAKNIDTVIMPLLTDGTNKISTASLFELILAGNIEKANSLMPIPYTVIGNVKSGRQVGRTFGIPTANLEIESDKLLPTDGVYSAIVRVFGKEFRAVTNIGARPTFNCYERTIESFILDFDGDIYDSEIVLFLIARLRDTVKFENAEKLKEQIERDILKTREIIKLV